MYETRLGADQLAAMAAVIEFGSFDAAAERLHVTPSAVSQRIKALETRMGQVLVVREKPCRPTAAGIPLLRLAAQTAMLISEALAETSEGADRMRVAVAVAVNADSMSTWFTDEISSSGSAPEPEVVVRPGQPIGLPVNRRIPFGRIRNSSPPVGVWGVRRMGRIERNLGCRCPTRGRASGGVCWWIGPGSPTWSKGWLALSAVVAPRCAARECPDLPLCDVSRPSMTCPFGMVLGAVVAVAQQVCHDRRGYLGDEGACHDFCVSQR
jgi:hypothetical protein